MKFTRLKTTVMAGVLAASMVLPGMTALAAGSQITKDNNGKVTTAQAQKTVTVADGVSTLPTADQSITIKVSQVDNAEVTDAEGNTTQQPRHDVTVANKTLELKDTASSNAILGVADILSEAEITAIKANPGEYTFQVSEDVDSLVEDANGFGWTKTDSSVYYLRVIVSNDETPVVSYFLTKTKGDTTVANKKDHADFKNTYNKKSTDDDQEDKISTLVVKMVVEGDGVDLNTAYPAEVKVTIPETANKIAGVAYEAYVQDKDGNLTKITGDNWAKSEDGKSVTIKADLKDGESIVVKNMAVGSTYEFKDTYDGSDSSFVGREWSNNGSGKIGEDSSNETITLTFKNLTVTGVVTDIAPYVTLVVLAGAAVVAYMALKRRVAR